MPILATFFACSLLAYELRCEALTDPLIVQPTKPNLSWKLKAAGSELKNLSQTAYRVLVASDPKLLQADKGDLWDTGKVPSANTYGIRYEGKPLTSRARCWWKVKVWDQEGQDSAWSRAGYFGTGLRNATDWSADWIHGDTPEVQGNLLEKAAWIGPDKVKDSAKAPAGTYRFKFNFKATSPKSAMVQLTADNTFVLKLNGKELAKTTDPEGWRKLQSVDLLAAIQDGQNSLEVDVTNVGEGHCALIATLKIVDQNNATTLLNTSESWSCDGTAARVVAQFGGGPWGAITTGELLVSPALYFEKPFALDKPIKRATAYVTALGIVDFKVNGNRVSEDLFTPGWTNYKKRLHYRAFDVTKSMKSGTNRIGATLGQGWYSGYVAWGKQREHFGKTPMLRAQVEIEFKDGTTTTISTDKSWLVGQGPILDEHFLHGEKYDARISEKPNQKVKIGKFETKLEAFPGEPVRSYQNLKAKTVKPVAKNTYQIDFGQNLSGFVKLKMKQPAGTKITIRHAERLDKDGRIYTTNLRSAEAIDTYTFSGKGTEEWNPRFTFHGFQYIEVSGLVTEPSDSTFTAIAISSATPESGTLATSDPMLNKLVSNAWWTQKMNFIDVPTDCPQRDERLGWTGDAQAYIQTATYYSDVQSFFTKWLVTLDDDQRPDGQYPMVAPVLKTLEDGGPAWADAGVICPMTIYDMYGDKTLLARHYPNMKRFIAFCLGRSKTNLLPPDQFHCFGDWLSINAETPKEVIAQAYFAESTKLVSRAAQILGLKDDAKHYQDLHGKIRKAFLDEYVTADGKVRGETQCSYVLALAFDLLDSNRAKLAEKHLIADIEKRNWHLSTGFVGTRDLMQVLAKIGRHDVAFRLLHNTTFPSWGFPLANGATSIWERWDGWTPEKGFQDAGMNSFAHYAYGAVVGWMFKEIGGISSAAAGFEKVLIAPQFDPKLTWAKCSYNSVRGPILTNWKRNGDSVDLTVQVPPNTMAEVHIPLSNGKVEKHTVGSGVWEFKGKP